MAEIHLNYLTLYSGSKRPFPSTKISFMIIKNWKGNQQQMNTKTTANIILITLFRSFIKVDGSGANNREILYGCFALLSPENLVYKYQNIEINNY